MEGDYSRFTPSGRIAEMAHNLWWTWNEDAKSLYSGLNPELWEEAEQNPVLFLERMLSLIHI